MALKSGFATMKPREVNPAVTVIALCYNHERYVLDCLESIRQQTFQDFELIVTDDFSQDRSVQLIDDWIRGNFPGGHFIRHTENKGLCKTLNEALRLARGRYVAMIATDDLWLPDKLKIQFAQMEDAPLSVGVVFSDAYQIDSTGQLIDDMFIHAHNPDIGYPEGQLLEILARCNFIPAMSTLIRMECFKNVGLYDESLVFEDWDMWLRIAAIFQFRFSSYVSAKYRILPTSMVRTILIPDNPIKKNTFFRIKAKCLEAGKLGVEISDKYRAEIWDLAYQLYVAGYPGSASRFFRVYRNTGRRRALLLAVTSGLGLGFAQIRKLRVLFSGRDTRRPFS